MPLHWYGSTTECTSIRLYHLTIKAIQESAEEIGVNNLQIKATNCTEVYRALPECSPDPACKALVDEVIEALNICSKIRRPCGDLDMTEPILTPPPPAPAPQPQAPQPTLKAERLFTQMCETLDHPRIEYFVPTHGNQEIQVGKEANWRRNWQSNHNGNPISHRFA
jgi:hypothetical protein